MTPAFCMASCKLTDWVNALACFRSLQPKTTVMSFGSREVLAALFWPDEPEAVAKQNLRQSLYRLRGWLDRITAPAGELLAAASVLA